MMADSPRAARNVDEEFSHDLDPEYIRNEVRHVVNEELESLKLETLAKSEKTQAEVLKLDQELHLLKCPWYRKPSILINITALVIIPGVSLFSQHSLSHDQQELQEQISREQQAQQQKIDYLSLVNQLHTTDDFEARVGILTSLADQYGFDGISELAHVYPSETLRVLAALNQPETDTANKLRTDLMKQLVARLDADFQVWQGDVERSLHRLADIDASAKQLDQALDRIRSETGDDPEVVADVMHEEVVNRFVDFREGVEDLIGRVKAQPEWMNENDQGKFRKVVSNLNVMNDEINERKYRLALGHLKRLTSQSRMRIQEEKNVWQQIVHQTVAFLELIRLRADGQGTHEDVVQTFAEFVATVRERPSPASESLLRSFESLQIASSSVIL
jgi:hypothetical protein